MESSPIRAPQWDDDKLRALVLVQAMRYRALVNLLVQKGVITYGELDRSIQHVAEHEFPAVVADMTWVPTNRAGQESDA